MAINNITSEVSLLRKRMENCVLQPWALDCFFMMQSVLCAAVRGPDGVAKYHSSKYLLRWYRRCLLLTAFEREVLDNPFTDGGGSFTGPADNNLHMYADPNSAYNYAYRALRDREEWEPLMDFVVDRYLQSLDELPHHFQMHFMHAVEIMGYKHSNERIRAWWHKTYLRLVNDLHLNPESEEELDHRLGDKHEQWLARNDKATVA